MRSSRGIRLLGGTSVFGLLAVGALAVGLGPAAGGGTAQPIQLSTATVAAATTVTVSQLPATASNLAGGLPQLEPTPAAFAAAKAAVNPNPGAGKGTGAGADAGPASETVTLGALLPSPLTIDPPNPCSCTPPDMALGVGDGFKMEQVNIEGQIWNSANTVASTFTLSSFYVTGGDFISDPWVFFDAPSGRWFAGIFDVSADSEAIAVSKTSDPTGGWFVYHITNPASGSGTCPDQGKGGVSDNIVALSSNLFANCSNGGYLGVVLSAYPKAAMLAGSGFTYQFAGPLPQYFSLVPAQSMGATTTQQFVGADFGTATAAHRVIATGTPPSATFTALADVPINTLNIPPDAVQPGTGTLVATGDDRVQEVAWQANSLMFTAEDACIPNFDTTTRSCARLIAINTNTGAKTIDKNRSKKAQYYFYPAPRPDPAGTIVVAVGRSSSKLFPQLDVYTSTPKGKLSATKVVQTGNADDLTTRHGDYFAAAIDPASPTSAWVAGGVGGHNSRGANGWGTAVGQVIVTP
jgi:hypothetical protein